MSSPYNGEHVRIARRYYPWRCFVCGTAQRLQVHHLDHDENNNQPSNLRVLCRYHHLEAHGKKPSNIAWYGPLWLTRPPQRITWITWALMMICLILTGLLLYGVL
jgi:hypothetical protein